MALLSAEKVILVRIFRQLRRKGFNYKNILLVGTGPRALRFARLFRENPEFGLHIIGFINETDDPMESPLADYPLLGMLNDIPRICKSNTVDQVLFAVPYDRLSRVEEVMPFLEDIGARIDIAMDYFSPKLSRAQQTDFLGIPLLSFSQHRGEGVSVYHQTAV